MSLRGLEALPPTPLQVLALAGVAADDLERVLGRALTLVLASLVLRGAADDDPHRLVVLAGLHDALDVGVLRDERLGLGALLRRRGLLGPLRLGLLAGLPGLRRGGH